MHSKKIYEALCVIAVAVMFVTTLVIGSAFYRGNSEVSGIGTDGEVFVAETALIFAHALSAKTCSLWVIDNGTVV